MSRPRTLLELAGAPQTPSALSQSAIVLIDCQMEYVEGPLALPGARPALAEARKLLERARAAGAPVIHVVHQGRAGGMFDLDAPRGREAPEVAPIAGEAIVKKPLPNSFAKTDLDEVLKRTGRTELIVAGFMTHMCVSSTVRAALDLGYRTTVVANAAATRDLPAPDGGVIDAATMHRAALTELSDRFAIIVPTADKLPD
jgi:nicotinamidase-related amidase